VKKNTTPETTKGPFSMAPRWLRPAALLLLVAEDEAVAVELPDPGLASPVLVPWAFWDPSPLRPGPVPAPEEKY
jgi:hypothetical protein